MQEQTTRKYTDIILEDLGYIEEPLEQRAVVLCQILRSLGLLFRKYYTTPPISSMRSRFYNGDRWSSLGMVFVIDCDENYAGYVSYLFKQRMKTISKLNRLVT